ncbi:hypothetical protein AG0111_0g11364 [Alternaria gaisen]|uniref:Uncharacterized protein n=1 Tax=Alternaria gaisen TaxID=167740 RepID=A0ACB6F7M3_9PLEO|nr:hypothetical protein AG0111_0g11364 [Alternaria gaisen]
MADESTTPSTPSLAPWQIHNRFVDIVRSDACPILDLIPSYDRFRFDLNQSENTIVMYVGEYGDGEIIAHPDGSVTKRIIRDSKIRKAGTIIKVIKPMGGRFRVVAPFSWSVSLRQGISTPMSAPIHALVLMYMHIWILKAGKNNVDLPMPGYQGLYEALALVRNAIETENMLPVRQRRIPSEVLSAHQLGNIDQEKSTKGDVEMEGA